MTTERKTHWENIYRSKKLEEVSWYQPTPKISLEFIAAASLPKNAKIIDVGGGDSFLVDYLLDLGFTDISVLDISENALLRAQKRLGARADQVTWMVSDILEFKPQQSYDLWHDRAAFHFLTTETEIEKYVSIASKAVANQGHLIIGTFATDGPEKCSGIRIQQYSDALLSNQFSTYFDRISCRTETHKTPFDTTQNFVFCHFIKKEDSVD